MTIWTLLGTGLEGGRREDQTCNGENEKEICEVAFELKIFYKILIICMFYSSPKV